jgi:hypothetical protein
LRWSKISHESTGGGRKWNKLENPWEKTLWQDFMLMEKWPL